MHLKKASWNNKSAKSFYHNNLEVGRDLSQSAFEQSPVSCVNGARRDICEKVHDTLWCFKLKCVNMSKRFELIKKRGLCFPCFVLRHLSRN